MRTIWKFRVPMEHVVRIEMPWGAELLTAQLQGDVPMLWAAVDPEAPRKTRVLTIIGTGREAPEGRYVGTWQQDGYVWHLFDHGFQA